jgi:hypothetical protein
MEFSFSRALRALKNGHKVARSGWNGKGMWIILQHGSNVPIPMRPHSPYAEAGLVEVLINPHIDMMTADGSMQPGWLASQTDLLAEDWLIV